MMGRNRRANYQQKRIEVLLNNAGEAAAFEPVPPSGGFMVSVCMVGQGIESQS